MNQSQYLLELSDDELHVHNKSVAHTLECSLYTVGLALLVTDQRKLFLQHNCKCAIQYAVSCLEMARQKALELLRVMRALEKLPLIHEAFRSGTLRWSKTREVTRVADAESEATWLEFALRHTAEQVALAVTKSPRSGRRSPGAARSEYAGARTRKSSRADQRETRPATRPVESGAALACELIEELSSPTISFPEKSETENHRVKLVFELTSDQLARFEQAAERIQARLGRSLGPEEVLMILVDTDESSDGPLAAGCVTAGKNGNTDWREGEVEVAPFALQEGLAIAFDLRPLGTSVEATGTTTSELPGGAEEFVTDPWGEALTLDVRYEDLLTRLDRKSRSEKRDKSKATRGREKSSFRARAKHPDRRSDRKAFQNKRGQEIRLSRGRGKRGSSTRRKARDSTWSKA